MQIDVLVDARAERPGVVHDPGRACESHRVDLLRDLLGEPQAQVHAAAPRVVAGPESREQQAGGDRGDRHLAQRGHEDHQADDDRPHRDGGKELESG